MSTRIREFRKLRGMTLQALAAQVGTTAQTIQRLETGNMTVSLDWLTRIADVFGIPAAALLVSDGTASVPVLGDLFASGDVALPTHKEPATSLSLVISAPHPVAVHVTEKISGVISDQTYMPGSWLIAGKADIADNQNMERRDCLVATSSGRICLRRASIDEGKLLVDGQKGLGPDESIGWIAPILMAVRYF